MTDPTCATVWNAYGVDVTIVEMLPRVVPNEDEEISTELAKAFAKKKIKTLTNTRVEGIETKEDGVMVKASGPDGEIDIEAEQVLLAISFKPNVSGIGLEDVLRIGFEGVLGIGFRPTTGCSRVASVEASH